MAARVVVTDHAFSDVEQEREVASRLGADFSVHSCTSAAQTVDAAKRANVLLVNFAPIGRDVLEVLAPGATVIRYGIGYDNVDVESARALGIAVCNVPDYGIETVADHAAASLLSLSRRLPQYDYAIRTSGWVAPATLGPVRSFRKSTVGLVGMGKIAQAVVRRLTPFGFSFVCYDPYVSQEVLADLSIESVPLAELAERSIAVSLHAPSTPETYRLINAQFFERLPHGAVLVNTARGTLVDEDALAAALTTGTLAGAALDVTDPEPVPDDSPLRRIPSVVFTPHAAFYDEESLVNLQRLASEEAARAISGQPLRCPIA